MTEQNNSSTRRPRVRLGTPELRGTGKTELALIVEVNEAIKTSIAASESISLIAVNANLVAGRAGERASGFCVVAGELRRFSNSMAQTNQGWAKLIFELVRETALNRNQSRYLNLLKATGRCSDKAREAIAGARARSLNELLITTTHNSERVIELQGLINRAAKQRMLGVMIARSAMIESAYGGTLRPVLQQIATSIDASIEILNANGQKVELMMSRVN
jgi:methyl-accepting chemotaxis protein